MKKELKLPKFKDEDKEREFWAKFDLSKHFEVDDFGAVSFRDLKPTSRAISLRLPDCLLARIKERANELKIPYQSLIKQYIAKGLFSQ